MRRWQWVATTFFATVAAIAAFGHEGSQTITALGPVSIYAFKATHALVCFLGTVALWRFAFTAWSESDA